MLSASLNKTFPFFLSLITNVTNSNNTCNKQSMFIASVRNVHEMSCGILQMTSAHQPGDHCLFFVSVCDMFRITVKVISGF